MPPQRYSLINSVNILVIIIESPANAYGPKLSAIPDYMAGYHGGKAGILHGLADSESASDRYQDIPRNVFRVFFRREKLRPRHDDCRNTDKEEHIQAHTWNGLFHDWQLSYRRPHNHKDQQS